MTRLLATTAAVLALMFSGVVHGLWTDRWADPEDQNEALARLQAVPMIIGEWQGEELKTGQDGEEGLVSVSRRYVRRGTDQAVTVFLACGRPGPVSVHTPDVCYAASGYVVEAPARFEVTTKPGQVPTQFFTSRLSKKKATEETWLRIFWSWGSAGAWQVTDNPRLAFAGQRQLYKLYVLHEMNRPEETPAGDVSIAFLSQLLPELEKNLFERQ
jgi:hypothetical protein